MAINVGDSVPEGTLTRMGDGGPEPIATDALFKGKKVVFFAVPGAFTPTCAIKHLPGYQRDADAIRTSGVDTIACMAVNDVFVMDAWAQSAGTGDDVLMLADGNGDYAAALGLSWDLSGLGLGTRSQRFSMIVDDGVVTHLNVETPGEFNVSASEKILDQLG